MIILYLLIYYLGIILTLKLTIKKFGKFEQNKDDNLRVYLVLFFWYILLIGLIIDYIYNLIISTDITKLANRLDDEN